jgi:hypothetical protein
MSHHYLDSDSTSICCFSLLLHAYRRSNIAAKLLSLALKQQSLTHSWRIDTDFFLSQYVYHIANLTRYCVIINYTLYILSIHVGVIRNKVIIKQEKEMMTHWIALSHVCLVLFIIMPSDQFYILLCVRKKMKILQG